MTLASRLSTQANLGHMDTTKQKIYIIVGNLTLIQCQAIVVGFLGAVVAIVMGAIKSNEVELDHAYLLCASSLVTVSIASFVLGLITAAVIVLSRHCHINPDNVATPIAASLGDITSLALLSWVSTVLYDSIGEYDNFCQLEKRTMGKNNYCFSKYLFSLLHSLKPIVRTGIPLLLNHVINQIFQHHFFEA
nr:unnamed protein product [Callosobruchus chinensis]